jgi:anti-sigma factor RsiW
MSTKPSAKPSAKAVRPCNTPECRRLRELLSDYIDHSLHWRTTRSLESHLAECPPCRLYVHTVEQTIVFYRKRPVVDVPEAVRDHLRDLLRGRFESKPKPRKAGCCGGRATPARQR